VTGDDVVARIDGDGEDELTGCPALMGWSVTAEAAAANLRASAALIREAMAWPTPRIGSMPLVQQGVPDVRVPVTELRAQFCTCRSSCPVHGEENTHG
jgi:hypothetical protein